MRFNFKKIILLFVVIVMVAILFILSIVCIWMVKTSIVRIEGSSMVPTYTKGRYVVMLKTSQKAYVPQRRDVIIFNVNNGKAQNVKRVIGIPEDKVEMKDNKVYLNGCELEEPYILEPNSTLAVKETKWNIPQNHVFVLGDNRAYCRDSRHFGLVSYDDIIGRILDKIIIESK